MPHNQPPTHDLWDFFKDDVRSVLQDVDVIFGKGRDTGEVLVFHGRDLANMISDSGFGSWASCVIVGLDLSSNATVKPSVDLKGDPVAAVLMGMVGNAKCSEMAVLAALVKVVRGTCDTLDGIDFGDAGGQG